MPAVGMKLGGEYAALGLLRSKHDRAGTIAEQDAGGAILPIEDAAESLRTDDERGFGRAGAQHRVRDREGVEEAGTDGMDVEGNAVVDAEHRLDLGRR